MKGLEKRFIGRMKEEVTFIGFGALEIGRDWGLGKGDEVKKPDDETAGIVLNTVLDIGISLIDTASAYHRSEERIGKYISNRRDKYILASKCGEHSNEPATYYDFSYKALKDSIDRSLKLLNTDIIDLMQMDYNLLNQHNEGNIALAHEKGIGVLIRSGLARGLLTSKALKHVETGDGSLSQPQSEKKVETRNRPLSQLLELVDYDGDKLTSLALNFLYKNKGISSILLGTKNIEHLKKNFRLLEEDVENNLLEKAQDIVLG